MLIAAILAALSKGAACEEPRRYSYLEQRGAAESAHELTVRRSGDHVETRWTGPEKAYFNLSDDSGATREWRVRQADAEIRARREGNRIRFEGTRNGAAIQREVEIDASPWFQPLSYALGRFSQSQRESVSFWTIRPDNFDVVKLEATRLGEERVRTPAGSFNARKIRVSVDGFLSRFWEVYYWFREDDGLLIRYESPGGLPGLPEITLQLTG